MTTLPELVPDLDTLLALPPETLGRALMSLAADSLHNGMFSPDGVTGATALYGMGAPNHPVYPRGRGREREVDVAIGEGWHWLEINMFIMPATGMNGHNGWKIFTRRGQNVLQNENAFHAYAAAASFPKTLLHPILRDDVWLELAQGKFADAVFKSFRAVEIAVREAGNFQPHEVGVDLMRRAFHPANGPLTRQSDPIAEREALAALFAGAIGSYKNPHSHRTVEIQDAIEAQEMIMLASHLLRIVDARRPT